MSWSELEAGAPELARLARDRIERTGVVMLATLCRDGSPRIDPVEPFFVAGELVFGLGTSSAKARNLRRDPRCAVHAVVAGANAGEPDVKLFGRVEPSDVVAGWWARRDPAVADVYSLAVSHAVAIEWDLAAERMRLWRWSPVRGETVREQAYP